MDDEQENEDNAVNIEVTNVKIEKSTEEQENPKMFGDDDTDQINDWNLMMAQEQPTDNLVIVNVETLS